MLKHDLFEHINKAWEKCKSFPDERFTSDIITYHLTEWYLENIGDISSDIIDEITSLIIKVIGVNEDDFDALLDATLVYDIVEILYDYTDDDEF